MFDNLDPVDEIENMVDWFMGFAQDILLVLSAIGVVALILMQAYLAWRG